MSCFTEKSISRIHDVFFPFFKLLNPEFAHDFSMHSFSYIEKYLSTGPIVEVDKIKVGSLYWPRPIGLAAGLDKNGEAIDFFSKLSFGAIEVGTVTLKPQAGNELPRLFRLVDEKSLRNRMGFNNAGADELFAKVSASDRHHKILGINIGKNKDTSEEQSYLEYRALYKKFAPIADYLVINISSPNTPGLRLLQSKKSFFNLVSHLDDVRSEFPRDLYVKISPDLNYKDLEDIVEVVIEKKLTGIIATNTTIMPEYGAGGISGKLLKNRSREMRRECLRLSQKRFEVIGVGGVDCFRDLWEFWSEGGKVMQIYTSFIYQGPKLLMEISNQIEQLKKKNNICTVHDLIEFAVMNKNAYQS